MMKSNPGGIDEIYPSIPLLLTQVVEKVAD
jgi:hypothetical protein